jgi:hypothetical protein
MRDTCPKGDKASKSPNLHSSSTPKDPSTQTVLY